MKAETFDLRQLGTTNGPPRNAEILTIRRRLYHTLSFRSNSIHDQVNRTCLANLRLPIVVRANDIHTNITKPVRNPLEHLFHNSTDVFASKDISFVQLYQIML